LSHQAFDQIQVRCPRLGGEVSFGYCRTISQGLPCRRALICFEFKFPVEQYFRLALKQETFSRCFEEPGEGRYEKFLRTVSEAVERVENGVKATG